MRRETLAAWLFLAVALLCEIVAVIPVLKGGSPNVPFLAIGGFWLIVGLSMAAKARVPPGSKDDPARRG